MARPTKYNESVIFKTKEYIKSCGREATELPTIEGLAEKLEVDSDTINNWATSKDEKGNLLYPEFFGTIKALKEKQKNQLINDGVYGGKEVNSTMCIFLLKANHGMIETERRLLGNLDGSDLKGLIEVNYGEKKD